MNNLYVGNLPFSATEESVTALFSQYGALKSVTLIKDMETGQLKGFGFVEYVNQADAQKAIAELDGKDFNGRALRVNVARPRETGGGNRGGRRGGGHGGGGYGGHGGHGGGGYNRR